jgi:hypothetical protein
MWDAQINPEALSAGERVQLAGVLLQAWTAYQTQRHHEHNARCDLTLSASTHFRLWARAAIHLAIEACLSS